MGFSPIETRKINENIYCIKSEMVNSYVFKDKENIICIDCGINDKLLACEFEKININPHSVSYLFLTSSDCHNAGGINLLNNAAVYLCVDEKQMLKRTTDKISMMHNDKKQEKSYTLLTNGERIKAGNVSIRCISTPGYTKGSMSYLINDSYLFTGDAVSLHHGKARPLFRLPNMNTKLQKESIKKLAKLKDILMIFTAHTGYTEHFEEAFRAWKN